MKFNFNQFVDGIKDLFGGTEKNEEDARNYTSAEEEQFNRKMDEAFSPTFRPLKNDSFKKADQEKNNMFIYKELFASARREGFDVMNATSFFRNDDGMLPRIEQTLLTPWFYQGQQVLGFTDTDCRLDHKQGQYNLYDTDLSEFYIIPPDGRPRNLDEVRQPGDPEFLTDAKGNAVSLSAAHMKLREVASAAAEYPHVHLYEEWMTSRSYIYSRFNMPKPTTEGYKEYLGDIESVMADPAKASSFVGAIRRPSDLHIAYESIWSDD